MKSMRTLAVATAALALAACAGPQAGSGSPAAAAAPRGMGDGPTAVARLEPTRGSATSGVATFQQRGDVMTLHVRLQGLKPGQVHGFHIHDKGDCSSGDGMSTGGHFNPTAKPHAAHDAAEHHAGDLPSLTADAAGRVDAQFRLAGLTIGSGPTDIVGRGLIVHADPDDFKTQPTGNSGARIACGVIQRQGA